jgi:flavin reductase (DIM6/NTAB) family NADH-FMN oxidoreductase RutF
MSVSMDDFRQALGAWASGVNIVTTQLGDARRGLTASAFSAVCAEPPIVLVCLNTATGTCKAVEETGWFAVNMLGAADQALAEVFAGRTGLQGDDRFAHGLWQTGTTGKVPVLASALVALECRVERIEHLGTHAVAFGRINAVHLNAQPPLVYQGGRFQTLLPAAITPPRLVSAAS